jgi:hypothetical protein
MPGGGGARWWCRFGRGKGRGGGADALSVALGGGRGSDAGEGRTSRRRWCDTTMAEEGGCREVVERANSGPPLSAVEERERERGGLAGIDWAG